MGKQSRKKKVRTSAETRSQSPALQTTVGWTGNLTLHVLIIFAVAYLAYANTFSSPFVFDDEPTIVNNPVTRVLSGDPGAVAPVKLPASRTLGYLSFALNYRWGGLSVSGFHVVNFLIHVINALLVYWIVSELTRPLSRAASRWTALFSALLFAAHPLQTQAVTYIVQRFASLAALFSLLAFALYLRARIHMQSNTSRGLFPDRQSLTLFALSLVSVVCAMKSKETSFSLPLLIALAEFLFFSSPLKQRAVVLAPYLATMLIIPLTLLGKGGVGSIGEVAKAAASHEITRIEYLATQPRVLITYLRLFLLPVNQNLDYDYPVATGPINPATLLSFLILACLAASGFILVIRSRKSGSSAHRLAAFGIFWFFLSLSVESSLIPIRDVMFEHRMYLPLFGLVLAVMSAASETTIRFPDKARAVSLLLIAVIVLLATTTFERNTIWKSKVSLWEDVVRKSPNKVIPHADLGVEYERLGRFDDAMREYQIATQLNRKAKAAFTVPHYNLGSIYYRKGMLEKAVPELETALELNPNYAEAHNNLGSVYFQLGKIDKAMKEFQEALRVNPSYAEANHNLGSVYLTQKRAEDAVHSYQAALKAGSNAPETYYGLGAAYAMKGEWKEAAGAFEQALRIKPDYKEAQKMLDAVRKQTTAGSR